MKWKLLVFEFQFVPSISKIIHSVSNVNDSTWISQVWYLVLYSLIPILVIGSKANSHFSDTQLLMSYTWAKERFRNQCYSCICITMSKKSWFRKFATMKKQPEFALVSWRHCCWERNHYQYLFFFLNTHNDIIEYKKTLHQIGPRFILLIIMQRMEECTFL